jgi:hypothetical protein
MVAEVIRNAIELPPVMAVEREAVVNRRERTAPVGAGVLREDRVLTQVYERCREAFVVAQTAFASVQTSMTIGRLDAAERDELVRRVGDFEQWAQLALRLADRAVEEFARERAALRASLAM